MPSCRSVVLDNPSCENWEARLGSSAAVAKESMIEVAVNPRCTAAELVDASCEKRDAAPVISLVGEFSGSARGAAGHASPEVSNQGEDLYHLDRDALAGLDADLVVTQDLCAVCAVDVTEVNDALEYLACEADVLTIDPHDLAAVLESVRVLGRVTGTQARADELVGVLLARLDAVRLQLTGRKPGRTLVLEWTDPPFAPGHWVPEMVTHAGGVCILGAAGEKSYRTTWDEVAGTAPEVVVCAPCGFGLDDSARLAVDVAAEGTLPAGIPVWAVDANASFARPGPRLVDGIEALAAILHPDVLGHPDPALARRVA